MMAKSKTFYLTTAIPYVNAAPHIGHALEFVQTDVIARYQKSCGKEVHLVTGADENSLKNVHAAEKQGITTAALCERNAAVFKKMAEQLGLSFTSFTRTSNQKIHWPGVQKLWSLCDKAGDIYKKKYQGLYCVGCESFYEENELPNGICPEHGTKPELIEEENYFFKLSKYQKKLEVLIESDKLQILPESRKNEVLSFIRGGLRDFSISRSMERAKGWGVPVPNDQAQIQYVWFDALGTYITGIGYGTEEKQFKKIWPAAVHVIGKGILRFHAVYWPAMLLSAGLKLPKSIFVHGYITVEGQKMSKTLGNVVDPFYLIEKYGADQLRYCLLSEVPTFDDGDFSEKALIDKNNNELIANLGNLINRTMVFLDKYFDSTIPEGKLSEQDKNFLNEQKKVYEEATELLEKTKLREALQQIMHFGHNANKYFQDNKPWELVKNKDKKAAAVMLVLANQVKDLAILIEPYLPNTSKAIIKQLMNGERKWNDLGKLSVKPGHKIGKAEIVFMKIEEDKKAGTEPMKRNDISFADVDIEIGEIVSVEQHPDADKLYVEKVRMGNEEEVQVVSGLAKHVSKESLVGKKVMIVRNLAPAKIRGVESRGMLLIAEKGETVEIIECPECNAGNKVVVAGVERKSKKEISFKEFSKIKLEVVGYNALAEGKEMCAAGKAIKTKKIRDGKIC
jgi:methionyl-tRNA synthetase